MNNVGRTSKTNLRDQSRNRKARSCYDNVSIQYPLHLESYDSIRYETLKMTFTSKKIDCCNLKQTNQNDKENN